MFDLSAVGIASGTAAIIVDMVINGISIISFLTIFSGVASGAAYFIEHGIKNLIKWAGKKTIIAW